MQDLINAQKDEVENDYKAAVTRNRRQYLEGDVKATSQYTFPNQKEDAHCIVDLFLSGYQVISIVKKTKIGMDGLMIEIAYKMCTHSDDDLVRNPNNVFFLTGMSNKLWQGDLEEKMPQCFKANIFHHGKLKNADLRRLCSKGLLIVDEIDCGGGDNQVLHNKLKDAGILSVDFMKQNDLKIIFVSATMVRELHELYKWGDLHCSYKMTIPHEYVGHMDFLERGIVQEWYPMKTAQAVQKWIQEDIVDNYGLDFRVHFIRVKKDVTLIQNECIRRGISFKNHTSEDRLSPDDLTDIFERPLLKHVVVAIKGLLRRANLVPNQWKLRIGAWHELYKKDGSVDINTEIQAGIGRMTGYWRSHIEEGHKTGPYRTSLKAIQNYERSYHDPFGDYTYYTSKFKKNGSIIRNAPIMISAKNIRNLIPMDYPTSQTHEDDNSFEGGWSIEYDDWEQLQVEFDRRRPRPEVNENGFILSSTTGRACILQRNDITEARGQSIKSLMPWGTLQEGRKITRLFTFYENPTEPTSVRYIVKWLKKVA